MSIDIEMFMLTSANSVRKARRSFCALAKEERASSILECLEISVISPPPKMSNVPQLEALIRNPYYSRYC